MIRILAFLCCMLPITAFSATYNLTGTGSCIGSHPNGDPCRVSISFDIAEADFGTEARLYRTSGLDIINEGHAVIGTVHVSWHEDIEDICTDTCAYATTDPLGNLIGFSYVSFNTAGLEGHGFWSDTQNYWDVSNGNGPFYAGRGTWDVSLSAVPLPAALPLYGAGLALIGFIGLRGRKSKGKQV
ncbi:hypothetical protein GQF03_17420 [Sneathiella chungangensis]|uniref:VPLPA-CTERM sorting domain-containing protein n=1 Tax=Sneathiella chungangensis TaxID=1418234 RepID=A0A845MMH5_9PROT|nr:VPLPA-CTERM sorting domain-containing protein [Sneathiella chungangensis]MZR24117.1 hypothetical protein [Sneathiella chungangensis]